MARNAAGLEEGARRRFRKLRDEFWHNVRVPGTGAELNQSLEKAGRVADFLELAELMCLDALAPRGIVRRPLPRGAPDARRRGAARRRALRLRRRVGVRGRRQGARAATRSRSCSRTCTSSHAELQVRRTAHHALTLTSGARPAPTRRAGCVRYDARRRQPGHVVPRDARRRQRGAHRQGRGADRVRPRLPRGHLRHVRADDQRRRARSAAGHDDLPAAHAAASTTATTICDRAVARAARSR